MKLIEPMNEYAAEIAAYRQEFLAAGDSMDGTGALRRMEDPVAWIAFCQRLRSRETAPNGWMPATQFLYVREEDRRIVGMIDVRHSLNGFLEQYGGHIGYSVRPSERRKGYAQSMLREALRYCWRDLGMSRVLITCLEENEASRKTILVNGGVYESTVFEPAEGARIQRYWIEKPRVLLITGFEPFGGQIVNPSWESVRALLDRIGPWQLVKMRLPVVFGRAARQVIQRAEEIKPQAVLCVGQAGGRSALTPEMVGINLRHGAQPDNEGALLQDAPIDPDAPAAYFATVPVRAMARAIQEAGLPGQVSYSAGTFVCNDVLFSLLRHFDGKKGIACGFVHVPYQTGQGEPSMPPADIARALTAAIQAL